MEYPPGHTAQKKWVWLRTHACTHTRAHARTYRSVLRLTGINGDNDECLNCEFTHTCHLCHKEVFSSGVVQTADIFASGRYEVVAKVPPDSGLVWAIWTFHYEE